MSHEGLAASYLLDKDDDTRLTYREVKDGWGSCSNFVASYGLKPYEVDDLEEAVGISRGLKEARESPEKE